MLQMWREFEDDQALNRARDRLRQQRSDNSNGNASVTTLERRESENQSSLGDACKSEHDCSTWSHDQLGPRNGNSDHENSSREQSPDLGDVEMVRQIVRGWTDSGIDDASSDVLQQRNNSPRVEWLGENERERVRVVRELMQMTSQQRAPRSGRREEQKIGRDMLVRIEGERQRELEGLSEHRAVSDFAHRNRIQVVGSQRLNSFMLTLFIKILSIKLPSCHMTNLMKKNSIDAVRYQEFIFRVLPTPTEAWYDVQHARQFVLKPFQLDMTFSLMAFVRLFG